MLSGLISVALLSGCAFAQMDALSNVTNAFSMAQIVPDVIDSFSPMDLINITFTDSVTADMVTVDPGALLTMEQTADEPMFVIDTSASGTIQNMDPSMNNSFVLLMVDPDAPTPQMPNVSEFLHFLGGDFTADSTGLLSNSSPALMEFFSPTPPPGSDPHRYVVLVFSQPDDFDTTTSMLVNATTPRTNFSASDFAQQANLGMPIAGNFFLVGPADNSSLPTTTTDSGATPTDTATSAPDTSLLPLPNPTPSPGMTMSAPSLPAATPPAPTTTTSHGVSSKMHRSVPAVAMGIAVLTTLVIYF